MGMHPEASPLKGETRVVDETTFALTPDGHGNFLTNFLRMRPSDITFR